MSDRIKLAEAMGWSGNTANDLPDPEHDANDDYAVLEWMRDPVKDGKFHPDWAEFKGRLSEAGSQLCWDYDIGDYARAALKVIG